MDSKIKRGDIFFANLDPTKGAELKKQRPVLIVSNDQNNKVAPLVTVIPFSSRTEKVYRFEVFVGAEQSGLKKDSKLVCSQIRTISKERIVLEKVGGLTADLMEAMEAATKLHLRFS